MGVDLWPKCFPQLVVDMLHRIDAEAVDAKCGDHIFEDLDHTILHHRMFGEQVVEAEEVAVEAVLAGKG
ncbi:MAG: hypothetical protein PVF74_10655 [Anaerolineales bacterium]